MRIDLHVHSSAADGPDAPAEVVRRARAAGLDVLALTGHDTQAGLSEAREAAASGGPAVVGGLELSCLPDGRSVHLLAYCCDPGDEDLAAETERIRDDRTYRARAMVARLRELGASVTWEQVTEIADGAVIGRPHIARALAAAGTVRSPADAFTADWIADGGRASVDRYAPGPLRAVGLVRAAGGVPVVAHPRSPGYEIPDEAIVTLAAAGLAGLEVFHIDHDEQERARLTRLATARDLIMTGGSDDHGSFNNRGLGTELTPPDQYDRILSSSGGATPRTPRGGSDGKAKISDPRTLAGPRP